MSQPQTALIRALATAVAAGGTLLIVGHDVSASYRQGHTPPADMFFAAAEVAASLDPALWQVEVSESRPRAAKDAGGSVVTVTDAVVRARRR